MRQPCKPPLVLFYLEEEAKGNTEVKLVELGDKVNFKQLIWKKRKN
jgi:hypothetical protein